MQKSYLQSKLFAGNKNNIDCVIKIKLKENKYKF